MNSPRHDFLVYEWTGRLKTYHDHLNNEHTQALFIEVIRFYASSVLKHLADDSYWREIDYRQLFAAFSMLYDRGLVERIVIDDKQVRFRPLAETESELLSSQELIPVADSLMELIGIMRAEEANIVGDSAC